MAFATERPEHLARRVLLTLEDLRDMGIGYDRVHLSRLYKAGKFPKPLKLNAKGRIVWKVSEIEAWLAERDAEREVA